MYFCSVKTSGSSSVGRAQPCQGWGRESESRFPLKYNETPSFLAGCFCFKCLKINILQNGDSPPAFSFFPKSVQESVQGGLEVAFLNSIITRFFSRKTTNRINFFAWEWGKLYPTVSEVFKIFWKNLNTYTYKVHNYNVLHDIRRKYTLKNFTPP